MCVREGDGWRDGEREGERNEPVRFVSLILFTLFRKFISF